MIRAIAICVFRRGDEILIAEGSDGGRAPFARPLGGEIERGERSEEAVVREIREELGLEVVDLELLGVIESLFEFGGERRHEIVFVYDGRFADPSIYELEEIAIREPGWDSPAMWRRLDGFGEHRRLVPDGLSRLLS